MVKGSLRSLIHQGRTLDPWRAQSHSPSVPAAINVHTLRLRSAAADMASSRTEPTNWRRPAQ